MVTVRAFEAKTKLSALLERVEGGEEALITKEGQAAARLVPASLVDRAAVRTAIGAIKRESQGRSLRGLSVKKMRESGRA